MRRPRWGLSEAERPTAEERGGEPAAVQPSDTRRDLPNMAVFRERLAVPAHPGNTIVEMREEEEDGFPVFAVSSRASPITLEMVQKALSES
jgi:hypothetical protein